MSDELTPEQRKLYDDMAQARELLSRLNEAVDHVLTGLQKGERVQSVRFTSMRLAAADILNLGFELQKQNHPADPLTSPPPTL